MKAFRIRYKRDGLRASNYAIIAKDKENIPNVLKLKDPEFDPEFPGDEITDIREVSLYKIKADEISVAEQIELMYYYLETRRGE